MVDAMQETLEQPAKTVDWRGPHKVHCPNCKVRQPAHSLKISKELLDGTRSVHFPKEPDIAWFRRMRRCKTCSTEFLTAEVAETVLDELYRLRRAEAKRQESAKARSDMLAEVRGSQPWLDRTGNDVPQAYAAYLVEWSSWWLTHSSGKPVRARKYKDKLEWQDCGWTVKYGANSFAAGRALAMARDIANRHLLATEQGILVSAAEIDSEFKAIPQRCVLNNKGSLYSSYPVDYWDRMVFGATAVSVNDCVWIMKRLTGIEVLMQKQAELPMAA